MKSQPSSSVAASEVDPLVTTIRGMRRMLGDIGTTKAYELMNSGAIDYAMIGGRRHPIIASVKALIERSTVRGAAAA